MILVAILVLFGPVSYGCSLGGGGTAPPPGRQRRPCSSPEGMKALGISRRHPARHRWPRLVAWRKQLRTEFQTALPDNNKSQREENQRLRQRENSDRPARINSALESERLRTCARDQEQAASARQQTEAGCSPTCSGAGQHRRRGGGHGAISPVGLGPQGDVRLSLEGGVRPARAGRREACRGRNSRSRRELAR